MPHVGQGGFRRDLLTETKHVVSAHEKQDSRARVLAFTLKHMPKDGRFFGLAASWIFDRMLARARPNAQIVSVEHDYKILEANYERMPGGRPQFTSEEIGDNIYYGYRTNRARVLHADLLNLINAELHADGRTEAEERAFTERWLNWDAVWLDLCSNLAPASLSTIDIVRNGCRGGRVVPVSVTVMAGRETDDLVKKNIRDCGGDHVGRARLITETLAGPDLRVLKHRWFTYRSPSIETPGKGSTMLVVHALLDLRTQPKGAR